MALIVFVPGCVALTWWQASRALSGNTLSWVYTFEWPIFAAYAVFMWWKLLHEEAEAGPGPRPPPESAVGAGSEAGARAGPGARPRAGAGADGEAEAGGEDGQQDELAAYNRYLADLNASGRQKRW